MTLPSPEANFIIGALAFNQFKGKLGSNGKIR
jgi:hypothetical protein